MVPPLEESEDGNRASFPRWGKRSVISSHFTELVSRKWLCFLRSVAFPGSSKHGEFFFCSGLDAVSIKIENWNDNKDENSRAD